MDLDRLVAHQHGVCTTAQARDAGLTEDALRWRVTSGRWSRIGRGLYHAWTGPLDWTGRAHALVLRGGRGAALALDAAAYLHGVEASPPAVITLFVPAGREVTRLPGTRVRSRCGLVSTTRRGLPVTTAASTVLDLTAAPGCEWREAVAVAARWAQSGRVDTGDLATALHGRPRHPHRRSLELALGVVGSGAESLLEVQFVRTVVERHALPTPTLQAPGLGPDGRLRRDAEFPEWAVVVELDGRLGHEGEGTMRDRRRDRDAARGGRLTLRAGWVEVDAAPCELAVDVHETLRSRGWAGRGRACGPRCALAPILRRAA